MSSAESVFRKIEWGPLIVVTVGALLFLLGAGRFVMSNHFGLIDALYCCLALIPAGLLLLVLTYVFHHARLVSVILLLLAGLLVFSYPVFDVALGLALVGAIVGPALSEWKNETRRQKLATAHAGEDDESNSPSA